jgi:uncharacterized protein HemX
VSEGWVIGRFSRILDACREENPKREEREMNAEAKGMGRRIGGMAAIGAGLLVIGGGYWMQTQAKLEAQEVQQVAASLLDQAVRAEAQATNTRQALEEQLRQCERENSPGPDTGATDGTDEKPQDEKPQDDKPQDDREEK